MYKRLQESKREVKEVRFDSHIDSLKQEYLVIFKGVSQMLHIQFTYDENSDMWITYLKMSKMKEQDELKTEHRISITNGCYIPGKLLDGTDFKVLLDTGASKSFMYKIFYLNSPS